MPSGSLHAPMLGAVRPICSACGSAVFLLALAYTCAWAMLVVLKVTPCRRRSDYTTYFLEVEFLDGYRHQCHRQGLLLQVPGDLR